MLDESQRSPGLAPNVQKSLVLGIVYALILAFFIVDLELPLGYAGGMPYLLPVVVAGLWAGRTSAVLAAILCSVLTVLGFWLSFSAGVQTWIVIINRVGAICGIWGAAVGVILYKRKEELMLRAVAQSGHAQEARQESEARYTALIETAVDGIVTVDEHGIIESINPSAENMFGYTADEVIGKNVTLLIPASGDEDKLPLLRRDNGREVMGLCKDGTVLTLQLSTSEMAFKGRRVFSGFVRDITEEKEIAEQLRQSQKMEVIGSLASGVAHDVNNLLMGVNGCAEVAMGKLDPAHPARLYLREIKNSVTSGAAIAKQLLAFAGKRTHEVVVEIDSVIAKSEGMLRRLLGENVELMTDLGAADAVVACDEGQFEQVLLNLVVNARDAMPDGGRLGVSTSRVGRPPDGKHILFEVWDTGTGIDPAMQKKIFEPFFTTKGTGKGTGLGLATVQRIVKQVGGHIDIDSRPGFGTAFRIYFPEARDEPIAKELDNSAGRPGDGETILILEDEPLVRMTVKHYLERWGYDVIDAGSGAEAVRKCRLHDGPIHVLISDVVLPGTLGPQVADEMRTLRPDVKVIFMSAHARETHIAAGRLESGVELLEKPFTEQQLLGRLRDVLGDSKRSWA